MGASNRDFIEHYCLWKVAYTVDMEARIYLLNLGAMSCLVLASPENIDLSMSIKSGKGVLSYIENHLLRSTSSH